MPADKILTAKEAVSFVADSCVLGIGGTPLAMNPVGLALNLILSGRKDLRLVMAPIGGYAADMLIGSGAVSSVEFAQIGFEELGMAPNFRRFVQEGRLRTIDHT